MLSEYEYGLYMTNINSHQQAFEARQKEHEVAEALCRKVEAADSIEGFSEKELGQLEELLELLRLLLSRLRDRQLSDLQALEDVAPFNVGLCPTYADYRRVEERVAEYKKSQTYH